MSHQIDATRALLLALLLGAGMFIVTRLVPPDLPGGVRQRPRRWASRGMWWMTCLGVGCGLLGALLEDALGNAALVAAPYAVYRVCWAPAFWLAALEEELAARGLNAPLLGALGLLLIPVFWFGVFLTIGQLCTRWRAPRSGLIREPPPPILRHGEGLVQNGNATDQ